MKKKTLHPSSKTVTFLLGGCAIVIVAAIVSSPAPAFQASLQGLNLWWKIVFPALLPFLVLSEILIAYGWVHAIGAILEPLMKKLFHLPGIGGWVLTMGMTTGFPGGAQSAQQLYEQGDLNARDTGRLAALSHFCNPMMILVVIATGLMHEPAAGYTVIAIHWLSGILAFLTLHPPGKDHKNILEGDKPGINSNAKSVSLYSRIIHAAEDAHTKDGRSFGRLLGDSVSHAVQTLMMIGGYIIIFSVIIQIFSRITSTRLQVPTYWLSGLFEVHLGARDISATAFSSSTLQWSILSALLGFSGISALLQSMSLLRKTGVKWAPLIWTRLLHSAYAFTLTWILWTPIEKLTNRIHPVFSEPGPSSNDISPIWNMWAEVPYLFKWQGILIVCLLGASLCLVIFSARRPGSRQG